jgi:hypothetical protein
MSRLYTYPRKFFPYCQEDNNTTVILKVTSHLHQNESENFIFHNFVPHVSGY